VKTSDLKLLTNLTLMLAEWDGLAMPFRRRGFGDGRFGDRRFGD